jgi:hypothetical protein
MVEYTRTPTPLDLKSPSKEALECTQVCGV